jgi:FtsP/CotA-like multicopper oxidase with cupredoxin domain
VYRAESEPARDFAPDAQLRLARYVDLRGPPHAEAADRTYELTLSGGRMMGMGSDMVWMMNGRQYPSSQPLEVRAGERVRLKLVNMSMEDHPMHLHGHTFQVVSIGGQAVGGPLKDTLNVRHMEAYEIEFVAGNPGEWLFHCHNLVHMEGGLMTEVRYR